MVSGTIGKDRSLRYKLTYLEEWFATSIKWLKAERLNFPARQTIVAPLEARGFSVRVEPLSGRLPFNNHLLTFRAPHASAPAGGMTQP